MFDLYRETAISILPKRGFDGYVETDLFQANERIVALRERITEIENGDLGKIARDFSDGVVFSKDELQTMPTYCFYTIDDVLLAIELEEEYLRKHTGIVDLHTYNNEEDITPGQISIWDWLSSQEDAVEEVTTAA